LLKAASRRSQDAVRDRTGQDAVRDRTGQDAESLGFASLVVKLKKIVDAVEETTDELPMNYRLANALILDN